MNLLLGFIVNLVLGTVALWVVARFSADSPPIQRCFLGALIIETLAIPFSYIMILGYLLTMLAVIIVIVKIVNIMGGVNVFFAMLLYFVLRFILAFIILSGIYY